MNSWSTNSFLLGLVVGVGITTTLVIVLVGARAWRHAWAAGLRVSLGTIVGMRLRGTPATLLVDACVALEKAGVKVPLGVVEAEYLANRGTAMSLDLLVRLVRERVEKRA